MSFKRGRISPTDNHRKAVQLDLQHRVEFFVRAWPDIERFAREMGRGFPSSSLSDGPSGGRGSSIVERNVLDPSSDPSVVAAQWLENWWAWISASEELESLARGRVLPKEPKPAEVMDLCALCALCGLPAPKVRRIGDLAYHDTTCYHKARRSA